MNISQDLINKISKGINLTFDESKTIFLSIMNGKMGEDLIYNFLVIKLRESLNGLCKRINL